MNKTEEKVSEAAELAAERQSEETVADEAVNTEANKEELTYTDEKLEKGDKKKKQKKEKKAKSPRKPLGYSVVRVVLLSIPLILVALVAVAFFSLSVWYLNEYDISFKSLLQILVAPVEGTGQTTVDGIIGAVVPPTVIMAVIFTGIAVAIGWNHKICTLLRKIGAFACAGLLAFSAIFTAFAFRMPEYAYYNFIKGNTTLYEDYYVDPKDVLITADGQTKNLIYIYVESMETTFASEKVGGIHSENYIPGLTSLAQEGINFSDKDGGKIGGFKAPNGVTWTMAALLATTAGVNFAFPVEANSMNKQETFAPDLVALGDILEEKGYTQMFMCGSDVAFGGRELYFTDHGSYEFYDLHEAWENPEESGVPYGLKKGWGFEDFKLFENAKRELTELAEGDKPFNFTVLTVDTHPPYGGYTCEKCELDNHADDSDTDRRTLKNVLNCSDKQVTAFVEWCKEQPFYEDSVIIISGDHPRMNRLLVGQTPAEQRTMYNCFLNSAVNPVEGATVNRDFTTMDMFPTTLAAMGFKIEGERLGLGTNMFSGKKTVAEEIGYQTLNNELLCDSKYFNEHFAKDIKKEEE